MLLKSDVKQSVTVLRRNVKHIRHWLEEETSAASKLVPFFFFNFPLGYCKLYDIIKIEYKGCVPFPLTVILRRLLDLDWICILSLWSSVCIIQSIFWDLVALDLHTSNDWSMLIVIVLYQHEPKFCVTDEFDVFFFFQGSTVDKTKGNWNQGSGHPQREELV